MHSEEYIQNELTKAGNLNDAGNAVAAADKLIFVCSMLLENQFDLKARLAVVEPPS